MHMFMHKSKALVGRNKNWAQVVFLDKKVDMWKENMGLDIEEGLGEVHNNAWDKFSCNDGYKLDCMVLFP